LKRLLFLWWKSQRTLFVTSNVLVWICVMPATGAAEAAPVAEVRSLLREGRYPEAYQKVSRLLEESPNDPEFLHLQGVSLRDAGYLEDAQRVLSRARSLDPDNTQLLLDYAHALTLGGWIREADALLGDHLRQHPENEALRSRITAIREAIPDIPPPPRSPWQVYARLAFEYDDNVTARPDTVHTSEDESWRHLYSVYVGYRFFLQEKGYLPFDILTSYQRYQTRHDRQTLQSFDYAENRGNISLESRMTFLGKPATLQLSGHVYEGDLDQSDYVEGVRISGSGHVVIHDRLNTWLSLSWEDQEYADASAFPELFNLDGERRQVLLGVSSTAWKRSLSFSLEVFYEETDTEGSQFVRDRFGGTATATLLLPNSVRLHTSLSYDEESYTQYLYDPARLDEVWTAFVALSRPLFSDQLTGELNATFVQASSSQDFADYERMVLGAAMNFNF